MQKKSKKVQADFNAIIEAKMLSKAQALVDKARAKHWSAYSGGVPVPFDLDAAKLVREVVARVKKETLSLDCGSITDGVDIEGAEIIKLSDIDKSLPIDDQISPENVVEYTNIKGEYKL